MEDNIGMVNTMDIVDFIIILIIKFLWNQPQQSINQKALFIAFTVALKPLFTL